MAASEPLVLGVARSVLGQRWRSRLRDDRAALLLAQALEIPEPLARVLAARGIDLDGAHDFLEPTLKRLLPDPLHLRDMTAAAERLADAIEGGEQVAIFGDYDVDGATSAALLTRFLEAVGGQVSTYIPDRLREGYGPNAPAMRMLAAQGARVVITVNCGVVAFDPLQAAADAGLDVIVVDHHIAEARLPRALAIINPNRLDDESPHGQLAAVGVAFLLAVGLNRTLRERGHYRAAAEPDLREWLDLVALGTVCDVVPLTGVNRALVRQGLRVMARRHNAGLVALADVAGLDETPTAYHLGFVLGPRVNAGGRVGEASLGTRLLSSDDPGVTAEIAHRLDALNRERRAIEAAVQDAAFEQVERDGRAGDPLVIAEGEGWHPGVIGIVASRLKERYRRPAAVIGLEPERGKASCRSVPGVDIGAAITAARQAGLLENGGGHAMAAGFTVARDRLDALRAFLNERLAGPVGALEGDWSLGLDGVVSVEGASRDLVAALERAGPFGSGNAEPRFAVSGARVSHADIVGTGHVRCTLVGRSGASLRGIAFRSVDNELGQALLSGRDTLLHVAGQLRINRRYGDRPEIFINDAAEPAPGAGVDG